MKFTYKGIEYFAGQKIEFDRFQINYVTGKREPQRCIGEIVFEEYGDDEGNTHLGFRVKSDYWWKYKNYPVEELTEFPTFPDFIWMLEDSKKERIRYDQDR